MILEKPMQVFEQEDWQLHKMQDEMEVYLRDADDSDLKELKSSICIEASLSAIVAVLSDTEYLPKWVYKCASAEKIKTLSDTEFIYRNVAKLPWPMKGREFVMHSVSSQDPDTLEVLACSSAKADALPPNDKYVRVEMTESYWYLRPISTHQTQVQYFLKSDPGVELPAMLVNAGLDIGPMKTMKQLKKRAESAAYKDKELAFIQNMQ